MFEALQDRRLLAADFIYQAVDATPLRLQASGGQLQVVEHANPQVVLASRALADTTGVLVQANGFQVGLSIDASVPRFSSGIEFQGGGDAALAGPLSGNQLNLTAFGPHLVRVRHNNGSETFAFPAPVETLTVEMGGLGDHVLTLGETGSTLVLPGALNISGGGSTTRSSPRAP